MFDRQLKDEMFVDVTLVCNASDAFVINQDQSNIRINGGQAQSLKAHKVILSACSPFFNFLLMENPCQHPIIILPSEITLDDLKYTLEFVYKGEVDVPKEKLNSVLRTACQLKIKGLSGEEFSQVIKISIIWQFD